MEECQKKLYEQFKTNGKEYEDNGNFGTLVRTYCKCPYIKHKQIYYYSKPCNFNKEYMDAVEERMKKNVIEICKKCSKNK